MRNISMLLCLLLLSSTAFAASDIVATYQYQDGNTITIVTRDSHHVRMNTSQSSYMLLRDDKIYSISRDDSGKWMVVDIGQQMKAMSSKGFSNFFGSADTREQEKCSADYKKTGRTEKIAGYTGNVYIVDIKQGNKLISSDEVVLSTSSDLKKINAGWAALTLKMGQTMNKDMAESIDQADKAGYGGILRYGNKMKLTSLKKTALEASYYEIPDNAQVMNMEGMPDLNQQDNARGQDYTGQNSASSRQEYDQDQASQTEVSGTDKENPDELPIEEVKKGVQNLFKFIFK